MLLKHVLLDRCHQYRLSFSTLYRVDAIEAATAGRSPLPHITFSTLYRVDAIEAPRRHAHAARKPIPFQYPLSGRCY